MTMPQIEIHWLDIPSLNKEIYTTERRLLKVALKDKAKLSQTAEQQNVSIFSSVCVLGAWENNMIWNKSSMSVCGLYSNPPFRIKTWDLQER